MASIIRIAVVCSLLFDPSQAAAGVLPPTVSGADLDDMYVPQAPFSAYADVRSDVDRALIQARVQNKRVLIDLGANWCADCRILAGILALPQVRRFIDQWYVEVNVDVGRFDRNLDIPARFGIYERLPAVPAVLVLRPDGTLVNPGRALVLSDAGHSDPQAVANWLAYWAR